MKGQYWQVREKVFDDQGRLSGRTNYAVNGSFDQCDKVIEYRISPAFA